MRKLGLAVGLAFFASFTFASAASATAIPVTTTLDTYGIDNGSCSLREAVQSVNTLSGFSGCTPPDPFAGNSIDLVAGSTYTLNLTGSEPTPNTALNDLDVHAPVTIQSVGAGTGGTRIVAPTGDRVIEMGGSATGLGIVGIRITGGSTTGTGGGISNNLAGSSLSLTNATVDGNSAAGDGGGIYSGTGTTLALTNVTASGNHADGNGGSVAYNSANGSFIKNSTIVDSSTEGSGAGIANLSTGIVNITNTILAGSNSGGEASECSGTITSGNNNLIGTNHLCTISQPVNNGTDIIGADHAEVPANLAALADNGGPVHTRLLQRTSAAINRGYASGSGMTCEAIDARGTARPQEARCDIGAVEVTSPGSLTYAATTTSDALDAGFTPSTCSLREAVTSANARQATGGCPAGVGGGVHTNTIQLAPGGTYTLTRPGVDDTNVNGDLDLITGINITATGAGQATIDGNGAITGDRVIHALPGAFLVGDTISGVNIQNGSTSGNGGGIAVAAELHLANVTVIGNSAGGDGGGVHYTSSVAGDVFNSTVTGNQANGNGGGIYSADGFYPEVDNVTVTLNTADANGGGGGGGGIAGFAGGRIANTIVAGNTDASGGDAPDCLGIPSMPSLGYNLIGNSNNCNFVAGTGDKVGSSAAPIPSGLGGLANNGGTTLTHAPAFGSAALNSGDPAAVGFPACFPTDQRGQARPLAGRCDIGAVEIEPSPPVNPPPTPPAGPTGLRAAALKKCKKKKTAAARKKCKKKAKKLPL
jgi:CSLREA domain-containing protein